MSGCRVLITRALKQSNELSKALQNLGAEVTTCPMVEVRDPASWAQLDRALIHLSWYDWLAFSSTQSVDSFLHRLDELGHGRAELMSHRVCAIGQKTAERLKREKISVDLRPERFTAEALLEEFIKRYGVRQRLRGARMLMPASAITRDVIRPALDKVGVYVEVVEAFQVVLPASAAEDTLQNLRATPMDYAVFTSPATVANLATLFESDHLMPLLPNARVVCVNAATAETARSFGLEVHLETEEATGQALLAALVADRTLTSNS
ncbi:MAG: uroporphyrinogen-III synthase [Acidobacteriota bacterium]